MFATKNVFFQFVLGCIDANFCDQTRVGKPLTRSTKSTILLVALIFKFYHMFENFRQRIFPKIYQTSSKLKYNNHRNFAKLCQLSFKRRIMFHIISYCTPGAGGSPLADCCGMPAAHSTVSRPFATLATCAPPRL